MNESLPSVNLRPGVKERFAPSPSGRMHLGNVFTALVSWLSARSSGGTWLLRIEDLDPQRSRMEYARLIEDDLHWLGLDWDEGGLDGTGPDAPYLQSQRSDTYAEDLRHIGESGLTYPCYCTRAELMATLAPHRSDGRIVYPGTCRSLPPRPGARAALRLMVPDEEIAFTDAVAGPQSFNLARDCGDFILRRADGAWAYQLAVVADDAAMHVTRVTRGNDLLLSAAQQIYLYRLLGRRPPQFAHLPLLCNEEGQRLSKRDASLSVGVLRKSLPPEAVTGYLAWLAGIIPHPEPASPAELITLFSPDALTSLPPSLTVDKSIGRHGTL